MTVTALFLTDIDQRAAVKGSRDPLGLVPIWSRFGRQVIGNLTTITTSVRDFTVTILGVHFVERLRERGMSDGDLSVFLRWEQLAAYARGHINGDFSFRGVERVKQRLLGANRVTLSAEREHQILSNQKVYGLWGLFTVASSSSGLITLDPLGVREGRTTVDKTILPTLGRRGDRDGRRLEDLLSKSRAHVPLDSELLSSVAAVLERRLTREERGFYQEHLRDGGPDDSTRGVQRAFAAVLAAVDNDPQRPLSASLLTSFSREALRQKQPALAERLDAILACEAVLGPADRAFRALLARDGSSLSDVAQALRTNWGARVQRVDVDAFGRVLPLIERATEDPQLARRWLDIAGALADGDYQALVKSLVDHNAAVMTARGAGAAWVTVQRDHLRVRFRDEAASLPNGAELEELFASPYFVPSLRAVSHALRRAA
jgi:hypothetical protein